MLALNANNPYQLAFDPDNQEKIEKFLGVIRDIKKHNQGKEVIIILGEIEKTIFARIIGEEKLDELGMREISTAEMKQNGFADPKNQAILKGRVWRLDTGSKPEI